MIVKCKLKVLTVESGERRASCVIEVSFARSEGSIAPGLPAWVFLAEFNVLPEALEFKVTLGAKHTIHLSRAEWAMSEDFGNLIFKGILRRERNSIFNLCHERHVAELEHIEMKEADFLVGEMLAAHHLRFSVMIGERDDKIRSCPRRLDFAVRSLSQFQQSTVAYFQLPTRVNAVDFSQLLNQRILLLLADHDEELMLFGQLGDPSGF